MARSESVLIMESVNAQRVAVRSMAGLVLISLHWTLGASHLCFCQDGEEGVDCSSCLLLDTAPLKPNHVRAAYSRRFSREKTIRSALDFSIGPNFEDGRPFPLETSTDVVTVIIRRISDKYDKYVNGLKIVWSS